MEYYPPERTRALETLVPGKAYHWKGENWNGLLWIDDDVTLSEDNFKTQYEIEQSVTVDTQWIEDRRNAHKPIAEQLDMQYWDKINGTTLWEGYITQLKSDIPKST